MLQCCSVLSLADKQADLTALSDLKAIHHFVLSCWLLCRNELLRQADPSGKSQCA